MGRAWVQGGGRVSPRRARYFSLLRQRNVPKRKATLHAASLRFAAGNLRCSRPAGSRSNSLHCVALKQSRALIRWPLRSSAHPEGNPKPDIHAGHRFARPTPPGRKRCALRKLGRAKQWSVWLCGCLAVWLFGCLAVWLFGCLAVWLFGCLAVWILGCPPLLAAPAAGRLRGGMGAFARMLRDLTRRGCPSAARQRVASSTAHPASAPTQVCPVATRRGRRLWVAFLWLTFLWRSKEK